MPAEGLFAPIFTTEAMQAAISDRAWLQAMLDVEAGLARAEAAAGLVPSDAATAITAACRAERFDVDVIGRAAAFAGNPVIPLVRSLSAALPAEAAGWVHFGATSQDILDTATMLVARSASRLLLEDLERVAGVCATLAVTHRGTLMPGRTLLQHAVPVTFGLKAAGWLTAGREAADGLAAWCSHRLAVQLGGAAGTLAPLGSQGGAVVEALATELGLGAPTMPWHTLRGRVAELGAALGIVTGAMGKIGLDIALMAQTEVGEVSEPTGPGRGGSSTLPHKRNPVGAAVAVAAARQAPGLVSALFSALPQEHERSLGAWQAEWEPVRALFALAAGAVDRIGEVLEGLTVDAAAMRSNLDVTRGLVTAEAVALALAPRLGRVAAHERIEAASRRVLTTGASLRDVLAADPVVTDQLSPAELDELCDPERFLGAADAFIDRALGAHRHRARRPDGG